VRYYVLYQSEFSVMPQPPNVNSHKFIDYTSANGVEEVFAQFQGETMTETRYTRIVLRFVKHTSMSVGDVVIDDGGHAFMVLPVGFGEVELSSPLARTELALHLLSLGLELWVGQSCSSMTRRSWRPPSSPISETTLTASVEPPSNPSVFARL